mgnify:CR=1 FL=1
MWTRDFKGTNRHSGRQFNARTGEERRRFRGPDPYAAFQWKLEIDGLVVAHFQEVSGLSIQTEVVKFREGGLNDREHMLMGGTSYSNIVCKNGMTDSAELYNWRAKVDSPGRASARRNGSIIMLDGKTTELLRWNFVRGWPCKWEGPTLTGQGAITIETVEIAHEGLRRAS